MKKKRDSAPKNLNEKKMRCLIWKLSEFFSSITNHSDKRFKAKEKKRRDQTTNHKPNKSNKSRDHRSSNKRGFLFTLENDESKPWNDEFTFYKYRLHFFKR